MFCLRLFDALKLHGKLHDVVIIFQVKAVQVHVREGDRDVRLLQEVGLLLHRMHLLAQRVPRPCQNLHQGLGKDQVLHFSMVDE